MDIGLVQLRPFDAIAVLLFLLVLRQRALLRQVGAGLLFLVPYFLWHVLSAFMVGTSNGLREELQIGLVAIFAFSVAVSIDRINYPKVARYVLIGLSIVMAYSIIWHISNGYWTGWKRLNDPKAAFTFLPMVVSMLILFTDASKRRKYWFMWAALAVVIVMSGERKALLIFSLLTISLFSSGRLLQTAPTIIAGYALLAFIASVTTDPYLSRQLNTFVNLGDSYQSYESLAQGDAPISLSNAQRIFALHVSQDMLSKHPVVGVGTNAYVDLVRAQFACLPSYMTLGIHSEFLRILTENGIIGIVLYLLVWIMSLIRLMRVARKFVTAKIISEFQAKILPTMSFLPCLFYVAFEASGTHSFVVLIFISLLPELTFQALTLYSRQRRGRENPHRKMPQPQIERLSGNTF